MSGDGLAGATTSRPSPGAWSARRRSARGTPVGPLRPPRPVRPLDRWLVSLVRKGLGPLPARMVLWDGSVWPLGPEDQEPLVTATTFTGGKPTVTITAPANNSEVVLGHTDGGWQCGVR